MEGAHKKIGGNVEAFLTHGDFETKRVEHGPRASATPEANQVIGRPFDAGAAGEDAEEFAKARKPGEASQKN
jgi:hypothetical protein